MVALRAEQVRKEEKTDHAYPRANCCLRNLISVDTKQPTKGKTPADRQTQHTTTQHNSKNTKKKNTDAPPRSMPLHHRRHQGHQPPTPLARRLPSASQQPRPQTTNHPAATRTKVQPKTRENGEEPLARAAELQVASYPRRPRPRPRSQQTTMPQSLPQRQTT